MKKFIRRISLLALSLLVLAGCSIEGEDKKADTSEEANVSSEETTSAETKDFTVGVSISTLNNPFFISLKEGVESKAEEEGLKVVISDAQNDSSTQSNQIEDLITQGVDLIIINPVDSTAVSPSVIAANDADIPVICVDRGSDEGEVLSFISSDNIEGGKMAGEYILENIKEGDKVAQLEGIPGASSTRERGQGFEEATKDKIDLVASQTANFDRAEGLTVMENMIQANPDIKAVFCQNDEMALGAAEALSGKDDIIIVGFDGNEDAISAVKEGKLSATVAQKPDEMGKIAVDTAIKYLNGEEVDKEIASPLELVTK
ncbi:MAG: D-ribose ABC transporter substrate-binding protein [Anaerococcus sp.]|nr:D-ribose ABC transporter substrate-binding protein [Peptoniphilaceae bacterium]MDY3055670.1 D-ribose ABC transporter substrate-binding protein [Anaerococcus sp.]